MQVQLKPWGNSQGVRFPKEFLNSAGISRDAVMDVEFINGRIVLTPVFRRRSLKERAAAYKGRLNLSEEQEREDPAGSEVW